MNAVFGREELLGLLRDFHTLTGLRAVVFDACGADILSYPERLPNFCRLIRRTPEGKAACLRCDQNACRAARRQNEPVLYSCHAGLLEIIAPLSADGSVVGYLLLSHIVQGADEAAEWQAVRQRCAAFAIAEADLSRAYRELPRTPYRILRAAANLLSIAAQASCQARLARLVPDSQQERLHHFLTGHLSEPLNSERLCKALSLSRTGLYYLSQKAYGCGISEQVARLRIQKAMQLLTTTQLTNAQICRLTGFSDPAYFSRVFHKRTGFTPGSYRRQFAESSPAPEAEFSLL